MHPYAPPPDVAAASPTGPALPPAALPAGYAFSEPEALAAAARPVAHAPAAAVHRTSPIAAVGWFAVVLLVGQGLVSLLLTGVSAWSAVALAGPVDDATRSVPALVQSLIGPASWLAAPLCGLVFAAWLYVALRNVRAWGGDLRRGPGWSFGAWFVPVVHLWWPKQLVDDAWRGSRPDVPDGVPLAAVPRPGVTSAWWLLWLAAPAVLQTGTVLAVVPLVDGAVAAARLGGDPAAALDLAALQETVALWSVWAYALWTLCALLAAYVVGQVTVWQSERLRGGSAAVPTGQPC